MLKTIVCAFCGKECAKEAGSANRAARLGLSIYCDRKCAGLGRRKPPKTTEQRKTEKAAYDAEYRNRNPEMRKADKQEYHKRTYDPKKAAEVRAKRMPYHVEYCRRPEVKAKKHIYDVTRGAKERYGEFWECFLLSQAIHNEAVRIAGGKYELLLAKGYFDRSTIKRRRDYERLDREEPEICALGNLERGERW